ncbi:hypothetical protein INS17_03475 [Staphylococcus haemolyticus]|uniref:hypothetical protein n=1 Tax=Staphylococcus haemolyticus TaxID=1283 RepID=UPI00187926EB|nr:hypothetical protein [Staphylococcus haemolyticus]MBE7355589.1 hypothetical protein [Staphylococcus haemolyticus]
MKRTIEKSLIWTGIAIHIIGLLLVTIGIIGMYTAPNGSKTDNTIIIITYILTIIFLIIAIIVVTRIINDNKLAGILLIVLGVLVLIPNFISAILWLIAGIMLLTRKPKNNKYGINNRNKYQDGKKVKEKNVISNDPFEKKDSNSNPENKLKKEDVEDPFKY